MFCYIIILNIFIKKQSLLVLPVKSITGQCSNLLRRIAKPRRVLPDQSRIHQHKTFRIHAKHPLDYKNQLDFTKNCNILFLHKRA